MALYTSSGKQAASHTVVGLPFPCCPIREREVLTVTSMFLELGIFLSQGIWLWRVRHVRSEAKQVGKTYDEYIDQHPSKKLRPSASSESVVDVEAGNTTPEVVVTPLEKCVMKSDKTSLPHTTT